MTQDSQLRKFSVGVDGYNLAQAQGTGVATFARSLVAALAAENHRIDLIYGLAVQADAAAGLRETLFYAKLAEYPSALKQTLVRQLRRRYPWPGLRELVQVEREGRVIAPELAHRAPTSDRLFTKGGIFETCARVFHRYGHFLRVRVPDPPSVMHWTYPLPIRLEGAANVYTIHDLVPLRLPHTSLEDKAYHERLLRACIAGGDHICTVSDTSREDIVALLGAPREKVTTVGQPIDVEDAATLGSESLSDWTQRLFGLRQGEYFLFYGAIEPKKNVGRLIQAYLESGINRPLLIVGRAAWHADAELRLLGGAHGTSLAGVTAVRRIEYLPRPLLLRLIQGARAVTVPSLYEGFGLPAAEAMALGVPVLTSSRGGSAEVAAGAALAVDPYDTAGLATALRRLDRDDLLCASLAQAGRARAAHYGRQQFVTALEEVHQRAMTAAGVGTSGTMR